MENRREGLRKKKRVVIKVGSSTITHKNGRVNLAKIDHLARVISDLKNREIEVVLVSSGAIAVGAQRLNLKERPRAVSEKQAAAAVGQVVLMNMYQRHFHDYAYDVAQILVTRNVNEDEIMRCNAKNTFQELLRMKILPVVNENDTIATEEIIFGDNDTLSAVVAQLVEADLLILLSDIDGLYSDDPRENPEAKIIHHVGEIDGYIESIGKGPTSSVGTGGMATKISAAKLATADGIDVVIASGEVPEIILEIMNGEEIGTLFARRNKDA